MKKVFIFLLMGIFMISLVSAWDWDNTYDYNPDGDLVTIENAFGFGADLAYLKLTWGDTTVIPMIDQHVGTFELEVTEEGYDDTIFDAMNLINLKNGQVMTRGKQYKVKTYKNVSVDDYESICEQNGTTANETPIYNCYQEEVGSHIELQEEWTPISNPNFEFLPGIVYEIGVFVDVEEGDYGDWRPSLMGITIDEWAPFVGAILFEFYDADGSYFVTKDDAIGQSFTIGTVGANVNIEVVGVGIELERVGTLGTYQVHISGATDSETPNATLYYYGTFVGGSIATGGENWYNISLTNIAGYELYAGEQYFLSIHPPGQDDDSNYIKWELDDNVGYAGGVASTGTANGSSWAQIGVGNHDASFEIWGNIPIISPPDVTLTSPVDNANLTSSTVEFLTTATDPIKVDNVSIILDGLINQTNTSGVNGSYTFTITGVIEGIHNWSILVINNNSLSNQSVNRTFNFTQPPIFIDLLNPADTSTSQIPSVNVSCRAYKDQGVTQLNLTIDGVVNTTVVNTTIAENLTIGGFQNFAEGNYTWGCSALNPSTSAVSANRTFEVLYSSPVVTLISPPDNSNTTSQIVSFNFTATDLNGITNVSLFLNGILNETDTSGVSGNYSFEKTLEEGIYNWSAKAVSIFGKETNSSENSFIVHLTSPNATIIAPIGIETYFLLGSNETLNYSFTEPGQNLSEHLVECWYIYNSINASLNCTGNTQSFLYQSGVNEISIFTRDSFGFIANDTSTWNYTYIENNVTLNSQSYETDTETFLINVEGATTATLVYNETEYTTTKSGNNFNRTIQIQVGATGNNTVYWIFDGVQNSSMRYQNVSETVFILCDATYTTQFLNISFKDESDFSIINASIPDSTFEYWLGDGTVVNSYRLINNSLNFDYQFCASPSDRTFNVNSLLQYKQGSAYPQRIYSKTDEELTNISTELTLYLLSAADGIFVTFQVFGGQSNTLEGVSVTGERFLDGTNKVIAQGTTDAAGTVTFWLNPNFLHTFTYVKTGFESIVESLFPTQTLYTVTMGSGAEAGINDTAEGVQITILPQGSFLDVNTLYTFTYKINSSVLELDEFGFELFYNNGTSIHSDSSAISTGGTLTKSFNTSNETRLLMTYYYITDGDRINQSTYWLIYAPSDFSIYNFLTRVGTYISADMYGVLGDDEGYFAKAMLSIMILILVTGTISFRYGLSSEAAVTGLLFGIIFMLNVFNLIPTPDFLNFIELGDFLVFVVAIFTVSRILKEERR